MYTIIDGDKVEGRWEEVFPIRESHESITECGRTLVGADGEIVTRSYRRKTIRTYDMKNSVGVVTYLRIGEIVESREKRYFMRVA